MSSVNQVFLLGRLGAEPEMKVFQTGEALCRLRIATSKKWKDKSTGESKEDTQWHSVTVWGQQAENVQRYCHKGDLVHVQGELRTTRTEKNGEKRYFTEVRAHAVNFIGGTKSKGDGVERAATPSRMSPNPAHRHATRATNWDQDSDAEIASDEMPF